MLRKGKRVEKKEGPLQRLPRASVVALTKRKGVSRKPARVFKGGEVRGGKRGEDFRQAGGHAKPRNSGGERSYKQRSSRKEEAGISHQFLDIKKRRKKK